MYSSLAPFFDTLHPISRFSVPKLHEWPSFRSFWRCSLRIFHTNPSSAPLRMVSLAQCRFGGIWFEQNPSKLVQVIDEDHEPSSSATTDSCAAETSLPMCHFHSGSKLWPTIGWRQTKCSPQHPRPAFHRNSTCITEVVHWPLYCQQDLAAIA